MEWFLPYYWAAALGASESPMTWWGWSGSPLRQPAVDCAEQTAVDLELIGVIYEVLVEQVDCATCRAPLHRTVRIELIHRSLTAVQILVTTHCRGRKRHRHVASVVEQAGDLRFGQLEPH